jgi:hypothetical protein
MRAFALDDPFRRDQSCTRIGRARARPARTPRAQTLRITRGALCRTRTDDPFLTMEGRGCFERSRTLTSGHETPANRQKSSERPRRPESGRGETGGRNVDGKPATLRRRVSRADLSPMRASEPLIGHLGPACARPAVGLPTARRERCARGVRRRCLPSQRLAQESPGQHFADGGDVAMLVAERMLW